MYFINYHPLIIELFVNHNETLINYFTEYEIKFPSVFKLIKLKLLFNFDFTYGTVSSLIYCLGYTSFHRSTIHTSKEILMFYQVLLVLLK